jgi:hypothetical protein
MLTRKHFLVIITAIALQCSFAGVALSDACDDALKLVDQEAEENKDRDNDRLDKLAALVREKSVTQEFYDGLCASYKDRFVEMERLINLQQSAVSACQARKIVFGCGTECSEALRAKWQKNTEAECKKARDPSKR